MIRILSIVALWFAMLFPAYAADGAASAPITASEVKQQLLDKLVAEGYMSAASATEAKAKVAIEDKAIAAEESWTKWLSWASLFKVLGVILLLVAFGSTIVRIIKGLWELIESVPMYVYQGAFGAVTVTGTIAPHLFWASQSFYVVLFCSIANLIIAGWTINVYPKVQEFLARIFKLGIPPFVLISGYLIAYFGVLAVLHQSQIFGFLATVSVSALFGFGLYYSPGVLFLTTREKAIPALVWSHTLLLIGYGVIKINEVVVPNANLFAAGIEYYWTIALGVAFLITLSPWSPSRDRVASMIPFTLCFILANFAFSYGLKSVGSVFDVFAVLIAIEWVLYASWSGGLIVGSLCSGLILFTGGLFLERHGKTILAAMGF